MKKLITTILVMALIIAMCGTALATGETVTADTILASAGEPATIKVTYTGTESLALIKMQFTSGLNNDYTTGISSNYNCSYNPENGLVLISCYEPGGTQANPTLSGQGTGTVLFTISYSIPATCADGSYPIDLTVLEARNASTAIIPVSEVDGSIEIGRIRGDINGDGELTNSDLILLSRYLVDLISFTPVQIASADMNGDGVINNSDLIILSNMLVA